MDDNDNAHLYTSQTESWEYGQGPPPTSIATAYTVATLVSGILMTGSLILAAAIAGPVIFTGVLLLWLVFVAVAVLK